MFLEILNKIKEYDTIILHRHVRPDGDCIGSMMGLYYLITNNFKEKKVYRTGDALPEYLGLYGHVDEVSDELAKTNLPVVAIHGDMKQSVRSKVMEQFKTQQATVLVATDVAARGIDVNNLVWVEQEAVDAETYDAK